MLVIHASPQCRLDIPMLIFNNSKPRGVLCV
jgi:hypothetical protein